MERILDVRIGNVDMQGNDPHAQGFNIVDFSGWNDSPGIRRESVEIEQGHGSFDLPHLFGSRTIPISGYVLADSREKLGWYQGLFSGLLAEGESRIQVTEFGRTLWAPCRLGGEKSFKADGWSNEATFRLSVWCADSRKYGETHTFTGTSGATVNAHHRGAFTAAGEYIVEGSMPSGYTLNGPGGRQFIVTQPVVAGQPHTIDMLTGRLTIGGGIIVGGISVGTTWGIPGGIPVAHSLIPVSGSGSLTIRVKDTFI